MFQKVCKHSEIVKNQKERLCSSKILLEYREREKRHDALSSSIQCEMTNYRGLYGCRSKITAEQGPHRGEAQAAGADKARQRRQQPDSRRDRHRRRLHRKICRLYNTMTLVSFLFKLL